MADRGIGGTLYLMVDGQQFETHGNFEVTPSRVKRAGVAGATRVAGFTESPVVPSIKGDLATTRDLSLEFLESITNATVTIALRNGKTYVLTGAWSCPPFTNTPADGKVNVEFQGVECDEI
jgi:hypothetical protein